MELKDGYYLNMEPLGLLTDCGWARREDLSHLPGLQLQRTPTLGQVPYTMPMELQPLCVRGRNGSGKQSPG